MKTIVHKIRLLDVARQSDFEHWVLHTDYAACHDLPSVQSFDVHRVSLDADAAFHYIEIIRVTSQEAFEADMETPRFQELVQGFSPMAEVIEEIAGDQLGQGYRQSQRTPSPA